MSRARRHRNRVCYIEPEEPRFDDYLFCSSCSDYVYEYCSIHGPLLVIPDDKVPSPTGHPPFIPRAALTIPRVFLHLAPSTIPGAGIGVFSTLTLPEGVRFGPYRGVRTDEATSPYCWQIFKDERRPSHILDAQDANKSNWMRYVNCSRHFSEQNLLAFQYRGRLYYRTIKIVPRFTELLVFYGSEFASELKVDLTVYHSPVYMETLVHCESEDEKELAKSYPTIECELENGEQIAIQDNVQCITAVNLKPENYEADSTTHDTMYSSVDTQKLTKNLETNELIHTLYHETNYSENKLFSNGPNVNICSNENENCNGYLSKSRANQSKVKKYSCPNCDDSFATKSEYINHDIKIHDSKVNYKACTMCEYKTLHTRYLTCHKATHRTQKYICDICLYETEHYTYLKRHMQKHVCKICNNIFKSRHQLSSHMRLHSEIPTNDKNRLNKRELSKKKYIERPHACPICEKTFQKPYDVKRHMVVHNATRPYKCEHCTYNFQQICKFKQHMRIHENTQGETKCKR